MAECGGLENRCPERDRGFESSSLRQESHFEKSRLEASAQSASAWYFSAILKAFLKSSPKPSPSVARARQQSPKIQLLS